MIKNNILLMKNLLALSMYDKYFKCSLRMQTVFAIDAETFLKIKGRFLFQQVHFYDGETENYI